MESHACRRANLHKEAVQQAEERGCRGQGWGSGIGDDIQVLTKNAAWERLQPSRGTTQKKVVEWAVLRWRSQPGGPLDHKKRGQNARLTPVLSVPASGYSPTGQRWLSPPTGM
jgi:hypothetical protein